MRNANQLKGMIDDLLEASRTDTCKLQIKQSMIPIGEVIQQTMRSFRATYAIKVISLTWKIHDFRGTKGLAMVQNRCLCGFETKSEAFA